ncbi:hypothetical protein HUT19_24255 [Streptomyces sp. NA02950]|uniref:hypothetical protein n=1 Tax=Streptomyces sp. NA02950 TaxID=2742137 RepID=UPI001591880C|nr:hypothetical protein [Streptomyces sp. NA02950]QKV94486.1 hypothetical protein HUT19_24255 [Streptomyces sp. NA02950]
MAIQTTRARFAGVAIAVVTGSVCIPWTQTATAAEPAPRHCVVDARSGQQSCFATFTAAVDRATDGRVTDAPATPREAAASPSFRAELSGLRATAASRAASKARTKAEGDVIQGTFFDGKNFTGSSLTITGPGLCEKDGWVNYQHDLADDWKNRISSVQPWGNCAVWLYPEPGLGGDRDGPFDENTADIGQMMNDRTQSIGFS